MVAPWFPIGVDYKFVSINSLHSVRLKNVAALSLSVDSEFLFMSSVQSGYVGNFLRENLFSVNAHIGLNLGFFLLFGYSQRIESLIEKMQKDKKYEATCYSDHSDDVADRLKVRIDRKPVNANTVLDLVIAPDGGAALRIVPHP